MSGQLETNTPLNQESDNPNDSDIVVTEQSLEERKRFLESLRARPEYLAAIGSVAIMRAGVTVENLSDVESRAALRASAYSQDVKPKTVGDKWTARRMQKRLDKHATSIDENLTGAKKIGVKATLRGLSEREAIERNNGLDDLRIRSRATKKAIKRKRNKHDKEFKHGLISREELGKLSGTIPLDNEEKAALADTRPKEIIYRSGTGVFTGSQVERARARRARKAAKVSNYGSKLLRKAGVAAETSQTRTQTSQEVVIPADETEARIREDAPKLLTAVEKRYKKELADRRAAGETIEASDKLDISRKAFLEVASRYFGVEADAIETSGFDLATLERVLEEERVTQQAAKARKAASEAQKSDVDTAHKVPPASDSKLESETGSDDGSSELGEAENNSGANEQEVAAQELSDLSPEELEDALIKAESLVGSENQDDEEVVQRLLKSIDKIGMKERTEGGRSLGGGVEIPGTVVYYYGYSYTDSDGRHYIKEISSELFERLTAFKAKASE